MKRRMWKVAALVGLGGLLLQAGGCASIILQLAVQNILRAVVSGALSSLINSANAAASAT